jgi:hypothetical protein
MVLALLSGLVWIMIWIIWVIILDIFGSNHRSRDRQNKKAAQEHADEYETRDSHRISQRL